MVARKMKVPIKITQVQDFHVEAESAEVLVADIEALVKTFQDSVDTTRVRFDVDFSVFSDRKDKQLVFKAIRKANHTLSGLKQET